MLSHLEDVISRQSSDYCEIHYDTVSSSRVALSNDQIESIGTARTSSGNVRVLHKGGWGLSTFNHQDFHKALLLASENARLVHRPPLTLPATAPLRDSITTPVQHHPDQWTLEQKLELARSYNDLLRHEKIATTRVIYQDYTLTRYMVNSMGAVLRQEKTFCGLMLGASARSGNSVQQAYESVGQYGGLELVTGLEEKADGVKQRALDLLQAPSVDAGTYQVILDPRLAGVFAHEAFGHLSEADFLAENPRMQEVMQLGRVFGSPALNIIDDGSLPGLAGYTPWDEEGVPGQKNYLIKDGRLCGRLHSRETAARMQEPLSGNARAISSGYAPIVRMTNTYIDKGDASLAEMLDSVDDGIYAVDMLGGMTNLEMFTFSAGYAYRIRKGRICELLRDVVLTGNVFQTLQDVRLIGNDLEHHGGLGGCGKAGQSGLPVSTGAPHVLVENVLIGGR